MTILLYNSHNCSLSVVYLMGHDQVTAFASFVTDEAMQESLDRQMEGMVGEEAMSYFKPVRRMLLRLIFMPVFIRHHCLCSLGNESHSPRRVQ